LLSIALVRPLTIVDPIRDAPASSERIAWYRTVLELSVVAAMAMPTLPITWRTTLYNPAASVIRARGIVDSAAVRRERRHPVKSERCDDESTAHQHARPEAIVESTADRHQHGHRETARHQGESRLHRVVSQEPLQEHRQQEQAAVEREAQHSAQRRRRAE
jgi:hypothetical protein